MIRLKLFAWFPWFVRNYSHHFRDSSEINCMTFNLCRLTNQIMDSGSSLHIWHKTAHDKTIVLLHNQERQKSNLANMAWPGPRFCVVTCFALKMPLPWLWLWPMVIDHERAKKEKWDVFSPDLLHALQIWWQPPMAAEDLLVHWKSYVLLEVLVVQDNKLWKWNGGDLCKSSLG